jgi:succinyl-CoA synthetase alpha subunit
MPLKTQVMVSFYQDSVILMRVAAQLRTLPAVHEVAMFMGTPANHALLEQVGLATDTGRQAGPNDLIITVDAKDDGVAADAIAAARTQLLETRKAREESSEFRPRSLESALQAMPGASLVSLSIPGPYVKDEALSALRHNRHLFIFSDNVPVEDEVQIKREAQRRGLLCMGPDQGTAYLGGKGLGFANVVKRGRVGCVAASGTGLQAVVSRLDALGEGVSHAIGVGGRDLSEAVGGLMALQALDALAADRETQAIVLISKPPHPSVLARVIDKMATIAKPIVVCCIGAAPGAAAANRLVWVETLDQAADAVVALLAGRAWQAARFSDGEQLAAQWARLDRPEAFAGRQILGLYTGGTLAYETGHLLQQALGADHPHRILDLGDDEYTIGRPHPMIDPRVRTEMIVKAGGDAAVGVMLLDLVLGLGANENPAESLVSAVHEARRTAADNGGRIAFLASILGTAGDPQGLESQTAQLHEAGIHLFATNADAARCAAMLVKPQLQAAWMNRECP